MKIIFIFWFSNSSFSQGQTQEFLLHLLPDANNNWVQELDLSGIKALDFIALSIVIEGTNINSNTITGRIQSTKKWREIPTFGEDPILEHKFISELIYLQPDEAGKILVSFACQSDMDLSRSTGKIRIFVPQNYHSSAGPQIIKASPRYFTCPCPQPDYVPRTSWGSGFRLTGDIYIPPAVYTKVTHLIVHHSAGTNTSSNWPAVVAAIFDFHVNTNGWQDVGYNWLIDPNGVVYEGRGGGDNVRGAHMCGYNNNTSGICLLGNFVAAEPANEMIVALSKLLSWKACKENISPAGSSNIVSYPGIMQHISGHRDGCAPNYTECPGTNLYSRLPSIRSTTSQYITEVCGSLSDVKDLDEQHKLDIIPNPAGDFVKIKIDIATNTGEVKIMDISGRNVMTVKDYRLSTELNISLLNDGLYILKVESDGKNFVGRFVKN